MFIFHKKIKFENCYNLQFQGLWKLGIKVYIGVETYKGVFQYSK
jgi:hypothetical protein